MSSINSVRKLQILYFKENKKIKNLKNGEKKFPEIGIYKYYFPSFPNSFSFGSSTFLSI